MSIKPRRLSIIDHRSSFIPLALHVITCSARLYALSAGRPHGWRSYKPPSGWVRWLPYHPIVGIDYIDCVLTDIDTYINSSTMASPLCQPSKALAMRKTTSRKVHVSQPSSASRLGLPHVRTLRQSDIARDRDGISARYHHQTASKEGIRTVVQEPCLIFSQILPQVANKH